MISDLVIAKDHRSYADHFPGFPILPGAVLLDEALYTMACARALDLRDWQVSSVKFLHTVSPGNLLTLEHAAPGHLSIRFTIRHGGSIVASGVLSAIAREAGDGA